MSEFTIPKTMHLDLNLCRIELVKGDITDQETDAIVNAANASLAGGGGVDGAIHRRGGPAIMQETNEKYPKGCPTGGAVASGAGNLKAKFVFHAVGPRWRDGKHNEAELLQSAYQTCLGLAAKHGCRSIAFPSISTGIYGYPIQGAAPLAIQTVIDFLRESPEPLRMVRFCLFLRCRFGGLHESTGSGVPVMLSPVKGKSRPGNLPILIMSPAYRFLA